MLWPREENGGNEFVRWATEPRESGTMKRGRLRKRWMDCVQDDGRVVDLDKVDDRIAWSKVSRRDDDESPVSSRCRTSCCKDP
jgi:hypothetical protein